MRLIVAIIGLCFLLLSAAAQKIVSGNVSLFNSKYKTGKPVFVNDVEVNGECCTTPGYSDANGYYRLVFRNLSGEARVTANKPGMRVINQPDLRLVPDEGKENLLNIYVFDNDEWAKEVRKIRMGLKKEIDKRYDSVIALLRTENKELKNTLNNLSARFNASGLTIAKAKAMLEAKRMEDLYYAGKQAEDVARIDLDNAHETTVNAYRAFINGDTKEVLDLTSNLDPSQDLDDIARYREWKTIRYILRARAAVMELKFDVADTAYRQSLYIDSLNPDVLTEYAALLQVREENADPIFRSYDNSLPLYRKAIPLFEKLIERYPVTYAPNYARALHNTAVIYAQDYFNNERRIIAQSYLERSLEIMQKLVKDEPGIYDWKLARTWATIGRFYKEKAGLLQGEEPADPNEMINDESVQRSDTAFTNEARILRQLAIADPKTYLPQLAAAIEDKAYLYEDVVNDKKKAAALFKEAKQVKELLKR